MAYGTKRSNRRRKSPSTSQRRTRPGPPLKVLMVIDQFNIGGTETHVFALTRELLRQGVQVAAAGKNGRMLGRFAGLGIPCYEIDFVLDNHEVDRMNSARHEALLLSLIERENISLIHSHQLPSGNSAIQAALRKRLPFVFTLHGHYYDDLFLERLNVAGETICVSPPLMRLLQGKGIRSHLVANGIEERDYAPYREPDSPYRVYVRSRLEMPQDAKIVMYASRLAWEKADVCLEVIRSVAELRAQGAGDVRLLIVGGGSESQRIEEHAREQQELSGERFIEMVGEVDNIHTYYAASDVVIGTGRVALEAMASGRPVLAAGSRGYAGIIRPEIYNSAWNTWFGDHDAEWRVTRRGLVRDLKEVMLMSGNRLSSLVEANLQQVRKMYQISRSCQEIMRIYERAMRQAPLSVRTR